MLSVFRLLKWVPHLLAAQVGLNKEPEKLLSLQATPIEPIVSPLVAEARTDERGTFRLRGLVRRNTLLLFLPCCFVWFFSPVYLSVSMSGCICSVLSVLSVCLSVPPTHWLARSLTHTHTRIRARTYTHACCRCPVSSTASRPRRRSGWSAVRRPNCS
jgi:hypothetical protein